MAVRYTRLPTDDPEGAVSLDYNSAFTYSSPHSRRSQYQSAFTYSGVNKPKEVKIVRPTLFGRICHVIITSLCFVMVILTLPLSAWFSFKKAATYERIVIFRLGRYSGTKGPGIVFILPCVDTWKKVDIKLKAFNVPPQQLITADGAIIEVGADVYFRIENVEKSLTCVQDLSHSTRVLLQTSFLKHLVKQKLAEVEEKKTKILSDIQDDCNRSANQWGVVISRIDLSPIKTLKGPNEGSGMPNIMMPPGLMGAGMDNSSLPQAIQSIASSFLGAAGPNPSVASLPPDGAAAADLSEVLVDCPAPSPRQVLVAMKSILSESLVRSVGSVFQFQVSGEDGGTFYLDLKNGAGKAGEGLVPGGEADATLQLSVGDMQSMFTGRMKPLQAYMSGRLKVSGDLSAALNLEDPLSKVINVFAPQRSF